MTKIDKKMDLVLKALDYLMSLGLSGVSVPDVNVTIKPGKRDRLTLTPNRVTITLSDLPENFFTSNGFFFTASRLFDVYNNLKIRKIKEVFDERYSVE